MRSSLPLVPGFVADFIESFASKRLPKPGHSAKIVRQRLYILPNPQGIIFFLVLLAILMGAINYQLSLGYMLCFLLGSVGLLGMVYTHQNLNHLSIQAATAKPVFAGQLAQFPVTLSSTKQQTYINIKLQTQQGESVAVHVTEPGTDSPVDIPLQTDQRGRLALPKIKIYTEYPLGLFYAWAWIELDYHCLVYPAPAVAPGHFKYAGQATDNQPSNESGYDDFAGLKKYQPGDAPKHLAWKTIAKTQQLQTKHFVAQAGEQIIFSWYQLADHMDIEQRLSVLCRCVIDADRQGKAYGLELPGKSLGVGSGRHHRHQCLKALALFGKAAF